MTVSRVDCFERIDVDRTRTEIDRAIPIEAPVAIEINGIGYAVMMATPSDLEDFAVGFALSEGLVGSAAEIVSVDSAKVAKGWVLRLQLQSGRMEPVLARARKRVSESSCGLCGMDNLDEVMRELPQVTANLTVEDSAIFAALAALRLHQPMNKATGAAHAAAFCEADGRIVLSREDVGRHNAFDKLLGALARSGRKPAEGFVLLTARCSFELVQKAVIANCAMLVTISAPTSLAVDCAKAHNLRLIALARPDAILSKGASTPLAR